MQIGVFPFLPSVILIKPLIFNPDFTLAYFRRGNVFLIMDDLNQAIRDFDKAIQLNPDFSKAYSARGIAYLQRQDWEHAIRDLDHAIQITPGSMTAYFAHGDNLCF